MTLGRLANYLNFQKPNNCDLNIDLHFQILDFLLHFKFSFTLKQSWTYKKWQEQYNKHFLLKYLIACSQTNVPLPLKISRKNITIRKYTLIHYKTIILRPHSSFNNYLHNVLYSKKIQFRIICISFICHSFFFSLFHLGLFPQSLFDFHEDYRLGTGYV